MKAKYLRITTTTEGNTRARLIAKPNADSKRTADKRTASTRNAYFTKSAYKSALAMTATDRAKAAAWRTDYAEADNDRDNIKLSDVAYARYSADAWNAVTYLYSKTPLDILDELRRALMSDNKHRNVALLAIMADEWRELSKAERAEQGEAYKTALDILKSEQERNTAAKEYKTHKNAADEATKTAEDIDNTAAAVLSIAADIVQAIAFADLERPTEEDFKSALHTLENINNREREHNAKHPKNPEPLTTWTDGELIEHARKAHRRAAAKAHIRNERGISGIDSTKTVLKPASHKAVKAWRDRYGDSAEDKQPTKGGFKSLVLLEATKRRKAGYYFKYEYRTIKAAHSFEAVTEREDKDGGTYYDFSKVETSFNFYVHDFADLEAVEDLANRANLSRREREFISIFAGEAARRAAGKARADYYKSQAAKGKRATAKGADLEEYEARRRYVYERMGLLKPSTRSMFFSRLCEALKAARTEPPKLDKHGKAITTPNTSNHERMRYFMERNHGNSHRDIGDRADLFNVWDYFEIIKDEDGQPQKVVNIEAAAPIVCAWLTAEQAKAARAKHTAKAAEETAKTKIDNSTASAKATAAAAHVRYLIANATADRAKVNSMNAAELLDILRRYTKHRTAAERKAKGKARAAAEATARAAAALASRDRRHISVNEWNSYTPAQRLEIIRNERFTITRG